MDESESFEEDDLDDLYDDAGAVPRTSALVDN